MYKVISNCTDGVFPTWDFLCALLKCLFMGMTLFILKYATLHGLLCFLEAWRLMFLSMINTGLKLTTTIHLVTFIAVLQQWTQVRYTSVVKGRYSFLDPCLRYLQQRLAVSTWRSSDAVLLNTSKIPHAVLEHLNSWSTLSSCAARRRTLFSLIMDLIMYVMRATFLDST